MNRHLVIGLAGPRLSAEERRRLARKPPLGVILFARNIESPQQVRGLLDDVRCCTGQPTWAAIDEEGGRVNRLPWPPFRPRRSAADYGRMCRVDTAAARRAVFEDARATGSALRELGLTHNCAPVLDVRHASGHAVIGERAYGEAVQVVSALGLACMQGLHAAGIAAVGKHFPGHGRADADSHRAVPRVKAPLAMLLAEAEPFRMCIKSGLKHIMTAHVVYEKADARVATQSDFWLKEVLRQRFGFQGRIWSDDLGMKGAGDDAVAAAAGALAAGCDVLLACEPEAVARLYAGL